MVDLKFEIGDKVWLHNGETDMIEGEVVFTFDRYGQHYVVEVQTSMDPVFYVREGHTLSDNPDRPVGMWRGAFDAGVIP